MNENEDYNQIDDAGAKYVAELINENNKIQKIHLSKCKAIVDGNFICNDGAVEIAISLENNETLTELSLGKLK